jgi:hypothetical protein
MSRNTSPLLLPLLRVDKKRDKVERKVLDSQERAFWDVHRPVVRGLSWIISFTSSVMEGIANQCCEHVCELKNMFLTLLYVLF